MIEKIQVTLWDLFTFFFVGIFGILCILGLLIQHGSTGYIQVLGLVGNYNAFILSVAGVVFPVLLGMLIEPMANYTDKWIFNYLYAFLPRENPREWSDVKVVINEITTCGIGKLNNKLDDPYHLCKEAILATSAHSTFMIYLSRYGFYRSISFITFTTGLLLAVMAIDSAGFACILVVITFIVTGVFKFRADQFYSYQLPAVVYSYYTKYFLTGTKSIPS